MQPDMDMRDSTLARRVAAYCLYLAQLGVREPTLSHCTTSFQQEIMGADVAPPPGTDNVIARTWTPYPWRDSGKRQDGK